MRSRRLLILLASVIVYLFIVSLLYQFGMGYFEGKPRTLLQSVEWAADTFTTTGYGRDTHWSHPFMIGLVMLVQFSGMVAAPLIIALFVLPFFAERFEQRLPRVADAKLAGHVIVYRFGPAVEMLLLRLRDHDVPTLVAETDEAQARNVLERGQSVVFSRSDDDILDACRLTAARALVANGRDEENAGVILRARQMGFSGEIYAFVEDPAHRKPIELAGATSSYTPRHIIAAALAAHASDLLSPRLPGIEALPAEGRRRPYRITAAGQRALAGQARFAFRPAVPSRARRCARRRSARRAERSWSGNGAAAASKRVARPRCGSSRTASSSWLATRRASRARPS